MSKCSKCNQIAEESLSIRHNKCGHLTHADCLEADGDQGNFKQCGQCTGLYASVPSSVKTLFSPSSGPFKEPHIKGSRDFVLHPGERTVASKLKKVAAYIPGIASRVQDNVETSTDPLFLLENREPLTVIMQRNGLGLDHFLQAGLTMRDFLQNGYTWEDLKLFEDISKKGKKRALQAISTGLCTTANDFRDYPEALPIGSIKDHTGFKTADLCRVFGLSYPRDGPLECFGDQNWNANQCIELGLVMDDLVAFGLRFVQQYDELMVGLTEQEEKEAIEKLNITPKHVNNLIDLNNVAEKEEEEQQNNYYIETEEKQEEIAYHKETEYRPIVYKIPKEYYENDACDYTPPPVSTKRVNESVKMTHVRSRNQNQQHQQQQQRIRHKFDRHGALLLNAK